MKIEQIEYVHGETVLEAYVAYNDQTERKRPGILIFHAWEGRNNFVCEKAKMMAKLGYFGCALDLYGKGVLGSSPAENKQLMDPLIANRQLLRERMHAGIKAIENHPMLDVTLLGAMGFCFGGLCALELARSGASLKGAVSVHGLLTQAEQMKNQPIQAKVLILHGHDDPTVPVDQVLDFEKEMTEAGVDWQVHIYGHTVHSFTNPAANEPKEGKLYSPVAEKRSMQAIQNFFHEIF